MSILMKNEFEYKSIFFRDWTLLFCEEDLFHYRTTDIIQRKPITDGRDTRQLLTVSSQETGSVVAQDLLTTTIKVPRLSTQHTELWSRWMQKTRLRVCYGYRSHSLGTSSAPVYTPWPPSVFFADHVHRFVTLEHLMLASGSRTLHRVATNWFSWTWQQVYCTQKQPPQSPHLDRAFWEVGTA